jgi:hypothetical protein
LLPIINPTPKNVLKFLEKAIFSKPNHQLSPVAEQLILDYEVFALSRYADKSQKPYYMNNELGKVNVDTYVVVGDHDLLFPFQKSIDNAKKHIKKIRDVKVFSNVAHGIETYGPALNYIGEVIKKHTL